VKKKIEPLEAKSEKQLRRKGDDEQKEEPIRSLGL